MSGLFLDAKTGQMVTGDVLEARRSAYEQGRQLAREGKGENLTRSWSSAELEEYFQEGVRAGAEERQRALMEKLLAETTRLADLYERRVRSDVEDAFIESAEGLNRAAFELLDIMRAERERSPWGPFVTTACVRLGDALQVYRDAARHLVGA